jgi:hypothetical protein
MWPFKKEKYTGPSAEDWIKLFEVKRQNILLKLQYELDCEKEKRKRKLRHRRKYYSGF